MKTKFQKLCVAGTFWTCVFFGSGLFNFSCEATGNGQPAPISYTNGLSDVVLLDLVMNFATNNLPTATVEANVITSGCSDATNTESLFANLTNGFCSFRYDYNSVTNSSLILAGNFDPNTNVLSNLIHFALISEFPANTSLTTKNQAYAIALACHRATNSESLYTNLTAGFCQFGLTNQTMAFTNTAASICLVVFNNSLGQITAAPQLSLEESSTNWGKFFFWTGAKLLSPYSINTSSQQLQSDSGTPADTFIEIDFDESYVMRSQNYDTERWPWAPSASDETSDHDGQIHWGAPLYNVCDISGSFGFVFGPGNSTNSYSASTIVSSGDIYGRGSIGLPLVRCCSPDFNWKQQLTLEAVGGFDTDKQYGSVHPNVLLGLGYQLKFPNIIGSTNLPAYWLNNFGPAWLDQPVLEATNVVFTSGNNGGLSEPEFRLKFVPFCWQTKIIYPVTSAVNIQLGGDVYLGANPASWDITLGVSLDLSKFATAIESGLQNSLGL